MNQPIKQHYIPRVYLKSFANSEKIIYQCGRKDRRVKPTTISKICYKPDYFTIKRNETRVFNKITDALHIEKHVFKRHENNFEKLLKRISGFTTKYKDVSRCEVREFIDILVTIKRRNPSMRRILEESFLNYINSDDFKGRIQPGIELAKQIDTIDPVVYVDEMIRLWNSDLSRLHDFYLSGFLGKQRKVHEMVLDTLMSRRLFILCAPAGQQFFTSDNPGFTTVDGIVQNFGGFNQDFRFVFPLTPQSCLLIHGSEAEDAYSIEKQVVFCQLDSVELARINRSTASISNEKVFSYSKDLLQQFFNSLKNFS